MSPAMRNLAVASETKGGNDSTESELHKGVKHLCEKGITGVPSKYILPVPDQPKSSKGSSSASNLNLKLPVIDFAELQGSSRSHAVNSLRKACEEFGFFHVSLHRFIPNWHAKNEAFVFGGFS